MHHMRLVRLLPLLLLALPLGLAAQQRPPRPPPKDTLTAAERAAVRETVRDAAQAARRNLGGDSLTRFRRADSASATAFANAEAREILSRARIARVTQDSALTGYRATITQRMSLKMGVRRVGLEKLLFRGDNVARVSWKQGVGVRVTPVGSRITIPMARGVSGDIVEAVTIPYYPGRETLWFPGGAFGAVKADIDERELIHPLARGAEIYYRYATGDSTDIRLPEGRVIRLRELRITARKPEWRTFVGSFWFDRDGGQLVRAVYRFAADIDIWDIVDQEAALEALERPEVERMRDSIARIRLPRELYVKDSTMRAERERARQRNGGSNEDKPPAWVTATFRPAKASLDAITVEYGLHEGRFWLPRAHSATASAQLGFLRAPFTMDEKFTYEDVNGDFTMAALPPLTASTRTVDSATGISQDSTNNVTTGTGTTVSVGASVSIGGKTDSAHVVRARRDSIALARGSSAMRQQCATDSVYTVVRRRQVDNGLNVAYDIPCKVSTLEMSPALPPAASSDEELFDMKTRDALLGALDMGLQPGFAPMPVKFHVGPDLARYNRVEGLSLGATATMEIGAGYAVAALGRIGHADLHPNGELSLARTNGARTVTGAIYHRLSAANPEWGGALSLGPSIPAFLYARDEGFYYRNFGAELRETRETRAGYAEYRLFLERQWTAGDSDVVNTFNVGDIFGNRQFQPNIPSERISVTGAAGLYQRAFGSNPAGFRLVTAARAEAGTGTFSYGRLALEGTLTRPVGRFATALTGSAGSSAGQVPFQRLWYMGGLRTVRGQTANTQRGNAFWLGRAEIGTRFAAVRPVAFFDIGWAGSRDAIGKTQPQRGAGIGLGFLDGLFRVDIARGLYPNRRWRTDFYLEAPL
jgi:hypothetical protein